MLTTNLPLPLHSRGKVRDTYRLSDAELLMVATDRISAFDVVLPTPIPAKGRVLTQLSVFWFEKTAHLVPNHLLPDQSIAPALLAAEPDLSSRSLRVRRAEPIPFECVVRGYLSGSGWKDYRMTGGIAGEPLPAGLSESGRLPQPIFTPATKALTGHDENISRAALARSLGTDLASRLEDLTLKVYSFAAAVALDRGLILADTKMEFGISNGRLILIDELLTPDSSRFWDVQAYQPGQAQPSFDKQFVRDYLETLDWDKKSPGPSLPREVVQGTTARYLEAWARLAGELALTGEHAQG